jgi:hypothetical protein
MKLFTQYRLPANQEVTYEALLQNAKTGDRIILYQGEELDEYVPGLHGVLVQCGEKIFWNDDVNHPVFVGACEEFFPFGQKVLVAKNFQNKRGILECNGTTRSLRTTVMKTLAFEVQEWKGAIYIRYGNRIALVTSTTNQVVVNEPFETWSVNNLGCIVQYGEELQIIGSQEATPVILQTSKLLRWCTSQSCVFYTTPEVGLCEWTGLKVFRKSALTPMDWFVTQEGRIIILEERIFRTLDDKVVYDGPCNSWMEHSHGVLIEHDGDLILAVAK